MIIRFLTLTSANPHSAIRIAKFFLLSSLLAPCFTAQAQQPSKVASIGYLAAGARSTEMDRTEALRQGLRELGYAEGKNITIEWRFAEENSTGIQRSRSS